MERVVKLILSGDESEARDPDRSSAAVGGRPRPVVITPREEVGTSPAGPAPATGAAGAKTRIPATCRVAALFGFCPHPQHTCHPHRHREGVTNGCTKDSSGVST